MAPFISFVIPVYNVRKFLRECVESVTSQQYDNWEIILVDDKSADGSGQLCDQYAAADPRIRTIHLPLNSGPGLARNEGLSGALGEYVYFLDGDDTVAAGELAGLCEAIDSCGHPDMMRVGFIESFGRSPSRDGSESAGRASVFTADEFLQNSLGTGRIGFQSWQFAIKKEMLLDAEIRFHTARICEDNNFTLRALFAARTVAEYGRIFYHWRTRLSGSLTSAHVTSWSQIVRSAAEMLEFACRAPLSGLQMKWAMRNVYSIIVQFEDVAGAVSVADLNQFPNLFLPFEKYLRELNGYVTDHGLLWHIKAHGVQDGVAAFCMQQAGNVRRLLDGRSERDIFVFPATRKALRLLETLAVNGFKIKGMLDNDGMKQGLMLDGHTIFSPEIIPLCYGDDSRLFVIISTFKRSTGKILAEQLRGYGLDEGSHFVCAGFEMD
jgi:glycosyltransferase involved in cell wall biosynthesis